MNDLIAEVGERDFEAQVVRSDIPVLVDFWAPWCGPCLALEPMLVEIAGTYGARLKIAKVNVDESRLLSQRYGIRSLPSLVVFSKGRVVKRLDSGGERGLAVQINELLSPVDVQGGRAPVHPAEPCSAYLGDTALKCRVLQCIDDYNDMALFSALPGDFNPGTGIGSPFAVLLQSRDLSLCPASLGIPESAAQLYESLFFGFLDLDTGGPRACAQAGTLFKAFLERISPGADLTSLAADFAASIVDFICVGAGGSHIFTSIPTDLQREGSNLSSSLRLAVGKRDPEARLALYRRIEAIAVEPTDRPSAILKVFMLGCADCEEADDTSLADGLFSLMVALRNELTIAQFTPTERRLRAEADAAIEREKISNATTKVKVGRTLQEVTAWEKAVPQHRLAEINNGVSAQLQALCLHLHEELCVIAKLNSRDTPR